MTAPAARTRRARAALGALGTLLLLQGACAVPPGESGGGFRLAGDDLRVDPPAEPSPWEVEVAVVRPDIAEITVHRDPPSGALPAAPASAPGGGGEHLTPIPSESLGWGSAPAEEGWRFQNPTVIGSPLVFLVTEDHGRWLRVLFPGRPNGQEGWIRSDEVTIQTHEWRIEIDVTDRVLRVYESDELRIDTPVVIGTDSTPTPLGRFYVNETQQHSPTSVYGSWIISTNGFSDSLDRFSGEVPIFAIHGTNRPDTMGEARSNGCVRIPNEIVEWMAEQVPVGTPVTISA